jgi:hypothetical protein
MNWKGYGRKWSWPNLRQYPSICLETQKKHEKFRSNPSLGQDLNMGPPKYEEQVLITQPLHLVAIVASLL